MLSFHALLRSIHDLTVMRFSDNQQPGKYAYKLEGAHDNVNYAYSRLGRIETMEETTVDVHEFSEHKTSLFN